METMHATNSVQAIQSLLHNVRAAEQTYAKLLHGMNGQATGIELVESILMDHERSGEFLSQLLDEQKVSESEPEIEMWKDLAFIIDTSKDVLQDPMAIKALQTGEERCQLDFEQALNSHALDAPTARWVRAELLPAVESHLQELSKLLLSLRAA